MKKANIKNYTSTVPAERSIAGIEKALIAMGATRIAKEYVEGVVVAISFSIFEHGRMIPFMLPAKKERVKQALLKTSSRRRPTSQQLKNVEGQAERTAWKNIKEWVELQATMIILDQVEITEIFMPYMYSEAKGQTLFEVMKSTGFKQIGNEVPT